MTIFIANSLSVKILLDCFFLVHQLIHNYIFYGLNYIFLLSTVDFSNLILVLYVFHETTIFRRHLLLFLRHFLIRFSAYINRIYIVYWTAFSEFLIFSFISLYSINTLFTEISSLWLICESFKALEIKYLIVFC